ncbi:MAG: hypothetical protein DMG06_10590 [Acidobacteria bacterium]|nr:MAG: hypothetical protein DMG06_10590 [Acidobacteriota bacterium]
MVDTLLRSGVPGRKTWGSVARLVPLHLLLPLMLTISAQEEKKQPADPYRPAEKSQKPASVEAKTEPVPLDPFETYSSKERNWWAYRRPTRPPIPRVNDPAWLKTPVDAFVLARLEKEGLSPVKPAERATLLQRVTFDLIGLPPTPEEIDAFVTDSSPDAYPKVVERLLASPHYGERWGRHWLDVVRYSDTDGFEYDSLRPHAWRYRDYVIKSFNDDKPYDRFLLEQLAGDEVASPDQQALVAVGFNRMGALRKNAGNQDEDMNRNEVLTEQTNAVGAAFMGTTLACARCHNHMFDPIRQSDYYRLQAFFAPSIPREISLATPEEQSAWEIKAKAVKEQVERLKKTFSEMEKAWRKQFRDAKLSQLSDRERKVLEISSDQRTADQTTLVAEVEKKLASKGDETSKHLINDLKKKKKEMMTALEELEARMPAPLPALWSLTDDPKQTPEIHILERGEPSHKGKRVGSRVPGVFLPDNAPDVSDTAESPTTGRRLALARWLASPENPLTARVLVNRLWHYHFNRGIVATPNDFGAQGAPPTHPELLDWLATELVQQHWNIKALHRLMVLSNTYQLASEGEPDKMLQKNRSKDPDNRCFWRFNRRRLEAEELRDKMLSVAGNLNLKAGGPGVFVPVQEVLMRQLYKPEQWAVTPEVQEHRRRSVYLIAKRNLRLPFMDVFDAPDMQNSCARREQSTHSLQALELMNGDFSNAQARVLAGRLLREKGARPAQIIERAFRLATGRPPTSQELTIARDFLSKQTALLGERANGGEELVLPTWMPSDMEPAAGAALCDFALAVFNLPGFLYLN